MKPRLFLPAFCAFAALGFSVAPVAAQTTLEKVKKDGVIKVCLAQGLPDNYKDPRTGKWTGVMVDLMDELATWMKVKVEQVEVGWDVSVLSLKQGACDVIGASLVYNAPRAMEVAYVTPFGAKGINVVIDKKNPKAIAVPGDLNRPEVTIAVEVGTREHETLQRLFPKAKILAVKVQSSIQVVDHVKRGDADAAALPTITVRWWLNVPENAAWGAMGLPGKDFGNAPNGWAVRQGDVDWMNFLNSYVGWANSNGTPMRLYDEYLARTNPFAPKN